MKRCLLNLLTALSLVLCVAAVALWRMSHAEQRFASHRGRLYVWGIRHAPGVGAVVVAANGERREPGPLRTVVLQLQGDSGYAHPINWDSPRVGVLGAELWLGEAFRQKPGEPRRYPAGFAVVEYWIVAVPYWWIVAAAALPPLVAATRAFRQVLRHRRNLCPACGYDLTGNVSGVCPECGSRL